MCSTVKQYTKYRKTLNVEVTINQSIIHEFLEWPKYLKHS